MKTCSRHTFHEWSRLTQGGRSSKSRGDGGGAERAELVAQTQKGGGANGDEEESRGREMEEEEEGVHFKAAPAGNRRLGCGGVSVSRTNCFGIGENPFVPNQFFHANCVKITNVCRLDPVRTIHLS